MAENREVSAEALHRCLLAGSLLVEVKADLGRVLNTVRDYAEQEVAAGRLEQAETPLRQEFESVASRFMREARWPTNVSVDQSKRLKAVVEYGRICGAPNEDLMEVADEVRKAAENYNFAELALAQVRLDHIVRHDLPLRAGFREAPVPTDQLRQGPPAPTKEERQRRVREHAKETAKPKGEAGPEVVPVKVEPEPTEELTDEENYIICPRCTGHIALDDPRCSKCFFPGGPPEKE
jgi:hypothetical protein